jgi:branched-chain amino acid transport system ATP-binding protein
VSNLLRAERGEVTKGSIEYRGEKIEDLKAYDLVKRGVVQVMEGRRCFGHLTVEENLLTGAYSRGSSGRGNSRAEIAADLEKVYAYFARLKQRRTSQSGYTSAGSSR